MWPPGNEAGAIYIESRHEVANCERRGGLRAHAAGARVSRHALAWDTPAGRSAACADARADGCDGPVAFDVPSHTETARARTRCTRTRTQARTNRAHARPLDASTVCMHARPTQAQEVDRSACTHATFRDESACYEAHGLCFRLNVRRCSLAPVTVLQRGSSCCNGVQHRTCNT